MNSPESALQIYHKNINSLTAELTVLASRRRQAAWLRFFIVVATILTVRLTWDLSTWTIILSGLCGLAIFLYVVSHDANLKSKTLKLEILLLINNNEIN